MGGRSLWWLALLLAGAASCRAEWPQFRHDAAHTARADEEVRPPLGLEWRFVAIPKLDPEDWYTPEEEQYVYPSGPRNVLAPGAGPFPGLLAAKGCVFLGAFGWTCACLDGKTGEVRWARRDPFTMVAIEGGLLVIATFPGSSRAPAAIGTWDLDTGEGNWLLTRADIPGLTPLPNWPQCTCWAHKALLCAHVIESRKCEYVRADDTGNVRTHFVEVFEPYLYFIHVADGSFATKDLCIPPGVPRGRFGESPYDGLQLQAWGDTLMVLGHPGDRPNYPSWRRWKPGPWAATLNGMITPTPLDAAQAYWGVAAPPVVLAEGRGLALGHEQAHPWRLTAREALTGEFLWSVPLLDSFNTHHSPAIDDERAYIGLSDGMVYALRLDTGRVCWHTSVGQPYHPYPPYPLPHNDFAPMCSVAGHYVWVVYRGKLLALDAETGEVKWETDETEAAWHEPVISDGRIYLLTCRGVEAWGPGAQAMGHDLGEGQ